MSARKDFFVRQGNTFKRGFKFKDGTGAYIDITEWVVSFSVKTTDGFIRKSTTAGTITRTSATELEIKLTPEETRLLPVGIAAAYEIETRSGADETTILSGVFSVSVGSNNDV